MDGSISVARMRVWLLVGAGLLVMVIAAFLGYAHYRAHRFIKELPGKLGMDITQETNAFTYSQSVQGKTLFTIHAAKAVQRKDGKVTLHDVGIVLYGRMQDRSDRIYGSEFEYDQKAGVIRAAGEVHLDLQAPTAGDARAKADYAAGKDLHQPGAEEGGDRLIHVKTRGLVFLRELGVAATDQDIEFEFHGMKGHAKGADYSSDTGVLVLQSEVQVNGLQRGRPVVLTAARAELDRLNNRLTMAQARYVSVGDTAEEAQRAEAQRAVVHLRRDGSAERVEAEGNVTLTEGDGGRMVAQRADALLSAANQPQAIRMYGGVRYVADDPLQQAKGDAAEGRATFNKVGRLEHVVLNGAVHLDEQVRASATGGEPWNERELRAGTVELALTGEANGRPQITDAKANGDARLKIVKGASNGGAGAKGAKGATSSALAADVLTAHFVSAEGVQRLEEVHGVGHTFLQRVSDTGVEDTSSGDMLEVRFQPGKSEGKAKKGSAGSQTTEAISSAVQQGNVVATHKPLRQPGDSGATPEQRATAAKAVYDGGAERVTLTGGVKVTDAVSTLWADNVAMEQRTGDAVAEGGVKASYLQPKAGRDEATRVEMVHVLASRAELKRAADRAIFYGEAGRPARLWQGGSQIEAPLIEFEQKRRMLIARGEGKSPAMEVKAVLVSGGGQAAGKLGVPKSAVMRVRSSELDYSDEGRKAEFSGGVQVDSAEGQMRGRKAVVYLQALGSSAGRSKTTDKTGGAGATAGGFLDGSVEQVVVTGNINMEQAGRHATGEQLVYTADDGMFVLTGTAAAPPKITDETRGSVTGASLRFHTGDESVVISNGVNSGVGQRVRTETRVKRN